MRLRFHTQTAGGSNTAQQPMNNVVRTAVEAGRVKAVYVIDPGPDGSLGDVSWLVTARRSGTLALLVVLVVGAGVAVPLLQGAPEQFVQGLIRKIGWVTTVVAHHPPAFGSMSAGSSRRSLSRHLALVGPMLPIERPRISAIVW